MKPLSVLALVFALPAMAQDDGAPAPTFWSPEEAGEPRGLLVNAEGAFDGYTLFAPLNSTVVYLVDLDGEVAHQWEAGAAPAGSIYLLDDGSLLHGARADEDPRFRGGGIGGYLRSLAPDGSVLWEYELANQDQHMHHDVEPLPSGNVLVITWERVSKEEAVMFGRDPEHVGLPGIWPDAVYEIQPTPPAGAEIVWEWHAWDHVVQDFDRDKFGYAPIPANAGKLDVNYDHRDQPPMTEEERERQEALEKEMAALGYMGGEEEDEDAPPEQFGGDWMHTNAVDYDAEYDLIALSSPELCEILVIDHSTTSEEAASDRGGRWGQGGEILWRWGNPKNYGMGADSDKQLFYQHDPQWTRGPDGDLRLTVFNNGGGRADGDYSSVDELLLPFDPEHGFTRAASEPFGPAEPAWSYSNGEHFFSGFISGAQRLANGNSLICSGAPGRLFEVTREGEVVWDYRNPLGGEVQSPAHAGNAPKLSLFRGTRLARDHPGVRALLDG
jgi:hypothetical protein